MFFYDFGMDQETYLSCGKAIQTPRLYECFDCGGKGLLHRHGFYLRYTITEEGSNEILICRLKCRHCLNAFSVIPDFLLPYFQHTLTTVIDRLKLVIENKRTNGSRQLQAFHLKRFLKKINWIHSFFVETGEVIGVQGEEKERAKKYLKMIQDFGESTFLRRSTGHYSTHFMAN